MNATDGNNAIRVDLMLIADMVEQGSRVLDVGCGDGALLAHLGRAKQVDGRGIELSMSGVRTAVSQGLSVIQGDADTDLKNYPSGAFDYVILSQTLQATRAPRDVLEHLLRIGRHAIVSFPNFAHWRLRWHLLAMGRMPVTGSLPLQWWETPNIHFCTIRDFVLLCETLGIEIERGLCLDNYGHAQPFRATGWLANLLGSQAVYLLRRR
ncbi:MAG: methionine biosynthesis protein MetW [Alphaproteobacteria bacterium]